jgi:hypothetical protein
LVWSQIGEEFNMGKNVVVKAFKTYHVVPSQVILYCTLPLYLGMAIVCPCCGTTHHKIGTSLDILDLIEIGLFALGPTYNLTASSASCI